MAQQAAFCSARFLLLPEPVPVLLPEPVLLLVPELLLPVPVLLR